MATWWPLCRWSHWFCVGIPGIHIPPLPDQSQMNMLSASTNQNKGYATLEPSENTYTWLFMELVDWRNWHETGHIKGVAKEDGKMVI